MVAVTFNLYDIFRRKCFDGGAIDFDTPGGNGIKAALVTNTYSPNQNTDEFFSTPEANEVTGTNYTAAGNVMATGVISMTGGGLVDVDFTDPAVWSQSGSGFADARRVIVYHDTAGASSTDPLIGYSNAFAADKGNVDGDFSVTVNAAGLFTAAR